MATVPVLWQYGLGEMVENHTERSLHQLTLRIGGNIDEIETGPGCDELVDCAHL